MILNRPQRDASGFTLRQTTELNTVEAQISIEPVLPNMRIYRAKLHLPMVAMARLLSHAVQTMQAGTERDVYQELYEELGKELNRKG